MLFTNVKYDCFLLIYNKCVARRYILDDNKDLIYLISSLPPLSVPDGGYFRNPSCPLIQMSKFLLVIFKQNCTSNWFNAYNIME
jgi:hypothetical protein